jgi:hypothetical protein
VCPLQANQFSQAIAPDKQLLGPALSLGQANQRLLGLSRSAPTDNLPLQLVGNQVGTFSNACSRELTPHHLLFGMAARDSYFYVILVQNGPNYCEFAERNN